MLCVMLLSQFGGAAQNDIMSDLFCTQFLSAIVFACLDPYIALFSFDPALLVELCPSLFWLDAVPSHSLMYYLTYL